MTRPRALDGVSSDLAFEWVGTFSYETVVRLVNEASDDLDRRSAGSDPAGDVHDNVRVVLAELGIDVSRVLPKPLSDEVVAAADVVIAMGCGDACPLYPNIRYVDWAVEDPADRPLDVVRRIRDDIDTRAQALLEQLAGPTPGETLVR